MASPHPLPPSVDPFLFFKGKRGVGEKNRCFDSINRRREILPNQWEEKRQWYTFRDFGPNLTIAVLVGAVSPPLITREKTLAFPPLKNGRKTSPRSLPFLSSSSVRSGEQVCLMSCDNRISKRPRPSTPQPWQEDQPVPQPNVAVAPNNTCKEVSTPPLI